MGSFTQPLKTGDIVTMSSKTMIKMYPLLPQISLKKYLYTFDTTQSCNLEPFGCPEDWKQAKVRKYSGAR